MFPVIPILASQFIAPAMFLNWPNFTKLTVVSVTQEQSEWYYPPPADDEFVKLCGLSPEDCEPYYIPQRLIITVNSKYGTSEITINEELAEIITLSVKHPSANSNSGDLGLIVFGIPGLLVSSPLLVANHLLWSAWEKMTGMERHAWSIWLRIKNQLDPKTYIIAEKAFQKYNGKDYGR